MLSKRLRRNLRSVSALVFFFNDTATTEIYTLSLHDALPIYRLDPDHAGLVQERVVGHARRRQRPGVREGGARPGRGADRKSTRLNSSHSQISYAVFCLKKKTPTQALLQRRPCLPASSAAHHD